MGQFDDLSDFDFELLSADLLSRRFRRRFESFPRGRDGGFDLRARLRSGLHYAQCKHYAKSSLSQLKSAARRELARLDEVGLKPRRYTFVTSRELTAANKADIVSCLGRLARDERDVLGASDLAALLREYPEVERAHIKLWLRSSAPLQRIVNAEVFARSEALLHEIRAAIPRYVQTESFAEARALLDEHRVVIVAGPPGVGKTTLARLLLFEAAEAGFVPYNVQSDISEAWRLFSSEEPQAFFFDDFLGRTALFDSVGDDARDVGAFIKRVRRSESTRLILATREYVLQQAEQDVEDLQWQELEADKYALTLDSYTRFDRARILYNHVYFSPEITEQARRALLRERAYFRIIDHASYTPRLIEWITGLGGHTLTKAELASFPDFCESVLDDPEDLWKYAYSQGLDDKSRCLLLQLPGLPVAVELEDLEVAYRAAAKAAGLPAGRAAFDRAIKVVQDSFVSVRSWPGRPTLVSVLNPSLVDFLKRQLLDDPDEFLSAFEGAAFFDQVDYLAHLAVDKRRVTHDVSAFIASAAARTVSGPAPKRTRLDSRELDGLVPRLIAMTRWTTSTRLRRSVLPLIKQGVAETIERVPRASGQELGTLPSLVERLAELEVDMTILAEAIKARALFLGEDLDAYDALGDLRRVLPSLFSVNEWNDILSGFEEWATYRLYDAVEWFEDIEDFDRFETVAEALGAQIPGDEFESARGAVEDAVAEREAEAIEEVDYDDYRDRATVEPGPPDSSSDSYIDGLFGMLDQ